MRQSKPFAGAAARAFAHLLGPAPRSGSRAEDNQNQDDEEARKARRAEEDDRRKEEDARRAEEDDKRKEEDARRAEEDGAGDGDGKDKDEGKGKKADDGTGDGDGDGEPDDEAKGRKAERARWTEVFAHANTAGRVVSACTMLADGDHSASSIIATLGALPRESVREGLGQRMSAIVNPQVGQDGPRAPGAGASKAKASAAAFIAAAHQADPSRVHAPTKP